MLATRIIKFLIEGFSPSKSTIEAVNELENYFLNQKDHSQKKKKL